MSVSAFGERVSIKVTMTVSDRISFTLDEFARKVVEHGGIGCKSCNGDVSSAIECVLEIEAENTFEDVDSVELAAPGSMIPLIVAAVRELENDGDPEWDFSHIDPHSPTAFHDVAAVVKGSGKTGADLDALIVRIVVGLRNGRMP